jgi:hypothetical protein
MTVAQGEADHRRIARSFGQAVTLKDCSGKGLHCGIQLEIC